jgi:transcriptional regulator with XRE-family HTH domain
MADPLPRAYTLQGATLRELVRLRRCSWKAVANACGVHVGTVKKWVAGKQAVFSDNLELLANFFGCKPAQLTGEEPHPALHDKPVEPPEEAEDQDMHEDKFTSDNQSGGANVATLNAAEVIDVEVTIDEDFALWDRAKQDVFLEGLRLMLQSPAAIHMSKKPRKGSVKITLRLTREQAEELGRLCEENRLEHLKIVAVNPIEGHTGSDMSSEDDNEQATDEDVLSIPVLGFGLSVRARNVLKRLRIKTLGDLVGITRDMLLVGKNVGQTTVREIEEMLASRGLHLARSEPERRTPANEEKN